MASYWERFIAQGCFLCPVWAAGYLLVAAPFALHLLHLEEDQTGPLQLHQRGKGPNLGRIRRSSRTPQPWSPALRHLCVQALRAAQFPGSLLAACPLWSPSVDTVTAEPV